MYHTVLQWYRLWIGDLQKYFPSFFNEKPTAAHCQLHSSKVFCVVFLFGWICFCFVNISVQELQTNRQTWDQMLPRTMLRLQVKSCVLQWHGSLAEWQGFGRQQSQYFCLKMMATWTTQEQKRSEVKYRVFYAEFPTAAFWEFFPNIYDSPPRFSSIEMAGELFFLQSKWLLDWFSVCPLVSLVWPVPHQKDHISYIQSKDVANVSETGISLWKCLK